MIIIPDYIEQQNIPAEEKLRLGKEFTIRSMSGDFDIKEVKQEKKQNIKSEDWNDPDIGVMVGPNGKKMYRFKGPFFLLFCKVYDEYSKGRDKSKNPKRNAAWAFYNTVIPDVESLGSSDEKNKFATNLLVAARKQSQQNILSESSGSTPIQMQGWLTQRRYEDYM